MSGVLKWIWLHLIQTATRGHLLCIKTQLVTLQYRTTTKQQVEERHVEITAQIQSSLRLRVCPHPQTGMGFHEASFCLVTTTSSRPYSIHCPFTGKRDTDMLLLCSFTTLITLKTTNHQYTAQYARCPSVSVTWWAPALLLCRGSLPWNLFEVIVPCSSSLCTRPSSQQVATVHNYL